ncbi:MAG: thiamine phosphate synthase [Magnetococcales bacterium]|nr:thiamine phosphate synthase [Magnetococcales bacterium]
MSPVPRLLLITDPALGEDLPHRVDQALGGGPCHVLLRDKTASARHLYHLARELVTITTRHGGALLIHDRADLALAVGAAGVHLPENGLPTTLVRRLLGPDTLVGRSCHDGPGARRALAEGADYVTLSPLFATASHPEARPLGIEEFSRLCQGIPGPVLALGGITPDNLTAALEAGAAGAALIRGALHHPDPAGVVTRLLEQLSGPPQSGFSDHRGKKG